MSLRRYRRAKPFREYFAAMVEPLPLPIVITTLDGKVLLFNQHAAELFGSELQPQAPFTCFSNSQSFASIVRLISAGGIIRNRVFQFNRGVNSFFFASCSAAIYPYGKDQAVIFNFEDQSSKIAESDSIRESEEKFRSIFENSVIGIFTLDEQLAIESVNRACQEILGFRESELTGSRIKQFIPELPDVVDVHFSNRFLAARRASLLGTQLETEVVQKSLKRVPIEVSLGVFHVAGRRFYVGLMQDVSLRKQAEHELLRSAKMVTIGEVAAGIVHEINNPLSVLLGVGTILEEKASGGVLTNAEAAKFGENITRMTGRMTRIIRSLKALSHMGENLPLSSSRVKDIFSDAMEVAAKKVGYRGVALTLPEVDEKLTCNCRPSEISQVLVNLVNNASDAVKETERPWIRVDLEVLQGLYRIRVIDSGSGIPFAIRDKIMESFFTTKAHGSGTGLGLSVSKKILKGHGGDLYVDFEAPNTTFVIDLPRDAAALSVA